MENTEIHPYIGDLVGYHYTSTVGNHHVVWKVEAINIRPLADNPGFSEPSVEIWCPFSKAWVHESELDTLIKNKELYKTPCAMYKRERGEWVQQ